MSDFITCLMCLLAGIMIGRGYTIDEWEGGKNK